MHSIEHRRSIRKYSSEPVDNAVIEKIISAGILAPSSKNRQPWHFIVYRGKGKEALLEAMAHGLIRELHGTAVLPEAAQALPDAYNTLRIMRSAPVIITVMNTNGRDPYSPIGTAERLSEINDTLSLGACIENILLAADKLGYGTLWIGNTCFAYPELMEFIGCKGQLACAIAVGKAAEDPPPRPRKALAAVLEFRDE